MTPNLNHYLQGLQGAADQGLFNAIRRGVEKETLRTTQKGEISQGDHPKALGSTLTHPHITTDYSEALLEFITPVSTSRETTLDFLLDLHRFSLARLDDQELLWPASMPCKLDGNASVRIGEYGTSNLGFMKHVYRRGLDARYGRIMQSIAGIHYNVSFPDALWPLLAELEGLPLEAADKDWRSKRYFDLIRNFRRHSWLLMYLFGASPALDASFLSGHENHPLKQLAAGTWGEPTATSLRMSDLGYQNKVQGTLNICFNSLENYINTLQDAIDKPYPDYAAIGTKVNGEYRQLNTGILQIENEYYSDIRPKRVMHSGQKPNEALREDGVEYIEVRCLDINPFLAGGIDVAQIYFLDAFLLFCLLEPSPQLNEADCKNINVNLKNTVNFGRDAKLLINDQPLQQQASELLQRLQPVCQLLDSSTETTPFCDALKQQQAKVDDISLTPSAQMLKLVEECDGYVPAVLKLAKAQREQL
ncbi:MAG: glutamate--cysteine ligase, partial [Pseudomonadaceae bacterium]|nr:glutamate--cysteine ligase [Pseudomonadaceae bacterium]